MGFDWNKLYDIAEYCNEHQTQITCFDKEAFLRTVINRAYYSAFNQANIFAEKRFGALSTNKKGLHDNLIETYNIDVNEYIRKERDSWS